MRERVFEPCHGEGLKRSIGRGRTTCGMFIIIVVGCRQKVKPLFPLTGLCRRHLLNNIK